MKMYFYTVKMYDFYSEPGVHFIFNRREDDVKR